MSDEQLLFLATLAGLFAYAVVGLLVLVHLDEMPRFHHHTRRWSAAGEWWALGLWPLVVAWLLWRGWRHG